MSQIDWTRSANVKRIDDATLDEWASELVASPDAFYRASGDGLVLAWGGFVYVCRVERSGVYDESEVRASRPGAGADGGAGAFPREPVDDAEREAVRNMDDFCDEWAPGSMSGICTRLPGHDGDHVSAQFVEPGNPDKRQHVVSRHPATKGDE
jgi:hypothetical protein